MQLSLMPDTGTCIWQLSLHKENPNCKKTPDITRKKILENQKFTKHVKNSVVGDKPCLAAEEILKPDVLKHQILKGRHSEIGVFIPNKVDFLNSLLPQYTPTLSNHICGTT